MPAQFAADLAGAKVQGLSGTIWQGQAQLDARHKADWDFALRDSMLTMAAVFDVQVTGNNLGNITWYSNPTGVGALPGEPRSVMATVRTHF